MPLSPDEVRDYVTRIATELAERIAHHSKRFPDGAKLLRKLTSERDRAPTNGLRAFDEIHNEVVVALALLESQDADVRTLRYEPPLPGTDKTIDFQVEFENDHVAYIDVKSIVPKAVDKWSQYEQAQQQGWMPASAGVVLDKRMLGGELWHFGVAARSRMLEYAMELEAKIEFAKAMHPSATVCLMLCSMGFHWSRDELEDFAGFYRSGTHRPDDPYSVMEAKHLHDKQIVLSRGIDAFAFLERMQFELEASEINWRVAPPPLPF